MINFIKWLYMDWSHNKSGVKPINVFGCCITLITFSLLFIIDIKRYCFDLHMSSGAKRIRHERTEIADSLHSSCSSEVNKKNSFWVPILNRIVDEFCYLNWVPKAMRYQESKTPAWLLTCLQFVRYKLEEVISTTSFSTFIAMLFGYNNFVLRYYLFLLAVIPRTLRGIASNYLKISKMSVWIHYRYQL